MIFGLNGEIYRLEPARVLLKVGGIIYDVAISMQCSSRLAKEGEAFLYTTQIIREDAHLLFGFYDEMEKGMFDRLIKINGVGPKVALAILSTYESSEILEIIKRKDVVALQRVPGIGAKGAGKIMVDLSGFYVDLLPKTSTPDSIYQEAKMALESLGFKTSNIDKVFKDIKATTTQDIIKEALKILR